jgi:hypothetical protein
LSLSERARNENERFLTLARFLKYSVSVAGERKQGREKANKRSKGGKGGRGLEGRAARSLKTKH